MKNTFGSGFGGKGDDGRSMKFTAAGAWFPLIKWGLIGLVAIVALLVLLTRCLR